MTRAQLTYCSANDHARDFPKRLRFCPEEGSLTLTIETAGPGIAVERSIAAQLDRNGRDVGALEIDVEAAERLARSAWRKDS